MPCQQVAAVMLLMVMAWQARPAQAQQLSVHLPLNASLVPDVADDPMQTCTTDQHISLTLDELLVPDSSKAAATVILQLALKEQQLSGAVILSAAGWHLTVTNGILAVTTEAGASILYDMGMAHSAVQTLSMAFDGSTFRLCINLGCPQPRPVSVLRAMPRQQAATALRRSSTAAAGSAQLLTPVCII
jgi:hypothetical protein